MQLKDRFIKYIKIDTQSDANSTTYPSTAKQVDFAKVLVEDMKAIGISDAQVDEYGIVYGTIPSNVETKHDVMGFIAHMDTSPDMSGKNVNPRIVENYDGSDIVLNEQLKIVMSPNEFSTLKNHIGHDLIVTDGTTLLGSDDKAGVAEILDMCQYIIKNDIPHAKIKIAFTPDEEVGAGADHFDVEKFGADYAYTVDGGAINSINFENFNAAGAEIVIHGKSIHPGEAKHKMVNALKVGIQFNSLLPVQDDPALTSKYEGFNHLEGMSGKVEEAHMSYIIRNHDEVLFEKQKEDFRRAAKYINEVYGYEIISLTIEDSYANMRKYIEERMDIVEKVEEALAEMGMEATYDPIRGGTDGARLTYMGLPTPNIGTGGFNYHGKFEYCSIQSMQKASELLVRIVSNHVK